MFAAASVVYVATANRGIQWQDSGLHILRVVERQPANPLGLALSHPLHHWMARMFFGSGMFEASFAVTLVSAIAGAAAAANVAGCVLTLTRRPAAAVFAAASLGVAHTFWQLSTVAETYTVTAALLSAECWAIAYYAVRRRPAYLQLALLFNGLGVANHNLGLLTLPVLAWMAVAALHDRRWSAGDVAVVVCGWLIGASLYIGMALAEWVRTGDLGGTLHSALFGHAFRDAVLNVSLPWRSIGKMLAFVVLCFPNLLLPAAGTGLREIASRRTPRSLALYLFWALAIHGAFVVRYTVLDQHIFALPSYVLLCIAGGVGMSRWTAGGSPRTRHRLATASVVLLLGTVLLYAIAPALARRAKVLAGVERHRPYRDDYVYLFSPWGVADDSAERMSREAVELAKPDGVIFVEDSMAAPAVGYGLWRSRWTEIKSISPPTDGALAAAAASVRPLVWVPANTTQPPKSPPMGRWQRVGDLYRLERDTSPQRP